MTNPSNISSGERAKAEAAYTLAAYNYPKDPVGSRDWTLYYGGWLHRAALATQPAPAEAVKVCKFCEGTGNDPGGLPVCRECRGLGKITTPVAQPAESKACASVGVEPIAEALRPFAKLGGPWDSYCFKAFQDLEDDVVVYSNSGSGITAGDVRAARKALEGVALASPAPSVVEPVWMTAFDDARDTILHGRDALEGALDNDQTNAVLSVLDDYFMPFLHRGATPPAAPAATEAPSDWRAGVADLILHLHQWQAAPVGNESTAAWDRLQGTINALATPAPAAPASVQPVLASLSDEQPMSLIDAIHALDIHNRSAKQMAVRISQNPGLLIEALRGLS